MTSSATPRWVLALLAGMAATSLFADEATPSPDAADRAATFARRLDAALESAWEADDVTPAERATDGAYLRRVCLDVTGRIPTAAEARDFLDDPRPSPVKRRDLVQALFRQPAHLVHHTNIWRSILLPEASSDLSSRQFVPEFEDWLRRRLLVGRRYDELVKEILTVPRLAMGTGEQPARPRAFFDLREDRPERLAAVTSRAFLGVRMECAQCHDHPFDDWTQEQFWQLAAFFAPPEEFDAAGNAIPSIVPTDAIADRDGEARVSALLPNGDLPGPHADPRVPLASWVTSDANEHFSRSIANRLWAQFFGAGLVEPVDDLSPYNPPVYPEVLQELAAIVSDADYDLDLVAEALVLTRLYNASSRVSDVSHEPSDRFARMPVRALNPEQLYDSLSQATGRLRVFNPDEPVNFNDDDDRTAFLEQFAREAVAAREQGSSILQALMMMNGQYVASATDLADSRTLRAVAEVPIFSDGDRIEALFLAAYARRPTQQELDLTTAYLNSATSPREGLADVFWSLLNSSEFLFNH